ncbi:MAG: GGDEF domain-containing protein [Sporomusaceae bacterium]|nr:GGDEF domain-containing protein [Sporomusaceae bacterium]
MRFLHKFTLLLSILVILSSIIQFFTFDRFFRLTTDSLLLTINEKAANNLGESLSAYFKNIGGLVQRIASDPTIRANQEVLDKANSIIPEINGIIILDAQGTTVLVSGAEVNPSVDLSQRKYFQRALQGETYISDVFTSVSNRQVIAISTPIIENNKILGVVVGIVRLHENNLSSMFGNKSFGRDGFIEISDGHGTIVFHPDRNSIGKTAENFDTLHDLAGSTVLKVSSGQEYYIGYRKIQELNWLISVNTPTAAITEFRSMMLYQILIITIITVLLVIIIGTYTMRRYTKPLDKVIKAFSSIKEGKYKKLPLDRYATEFDEMIQVYNDTIDKLEEVHITLKGAADIDGLTGAYNRRAFDKILELLTQEIQTQSLPSLGIMILDLDHFKQLNDTQGHLTGDDVLKDFTSIAVSVVGARSVFRFGGDEFAIILRNVPREKTTAFAEEIRLQSEKKLRGCTVSIGIANYPKNANTIDEILLLADKALYISKETKNKVTSF